MHRDSCPFSPNARSNFKKYYSADVASLNLNVKKELYLNQYFAFVGRRQNNIGIIVIVIDIVIVFIKISPMMPKNVDFSDDMPICKRCYEIRFQCQMLCLGGEEEGIRPTAA